MTFSVVDLIGPGKGQREHTLYLGIGDKNDNPAVKYFKSQRVYRLENELDWTVVWISANRVKWTAYDCPSYKGLRKHPDPECRELDSMNLIRSGPKESFYELSIGGRS